MKTTVLTLILCLFLSNGVTWAQAEEEKPTASLYVDVLSQYIWRGYALSSDSAVIEPSMTASYKGFSINVWGNLDTDESITNNGTKWNETDLTVSYTRELIKSLNATVGTIYYALNGLQDSFEVYAGVSYAFPWLTVGLTGYREVSHYPGWFVQLDLSRNFPLPWHGLNLDLAATFLYQSSDDSAAYPEPGDPSEAYSAFHASQLLAALNIPAGKYVVISPRVGYAFPLSDKASDEIKSISWDHDANHVFGGIRISALF